MSLSEFSKIPKFLAPLSVDDLAETAQKTIEIAKNFQNQHFIPCGAGSCVNNENKWLLMDSNGWAPLFDELRND